ncbi:hypothetical protein [Nonomuraea sp. NPDC050310]|uniref:hypothetical protein n=1 Tax=Nonomuraea sp. NPDC050310 TaxID=3154935 RepID=UPI0033EC12FC
MVPLPAKPLPREPIRPFTLFAALKLRLIGGNLRGAVDRKLGFVFTLLAALFVATVSFLSLLALRLAPPDVAADLGTVLFTAFLIGWAVVPLLAFGLDDTLDPARLSLFPLTTRQLAIGLFASSATGAWPLTTLIALFGALAGLARSLPAALTGLVAVPLMFALCLVTSRLVTTALSGLLRSRRGRDLLAVAAIALVLLFQLPNIIVNRGLDDPAALLRGAAGFLRWTPPGMTAEAISTGNPLWLLPVALTVAVVGYLWIKVLGRALVTPDSSTQAAASVRASSGLLDRLLPDGPLAAVVYKEVRYLRRDPRFRVSWLVAVVVTGALAFSMSGDGAGPALVIGLSILGAIMIGAQLSNLFGIDGRSLWMNAVVFAQERDFRTDIRGRHLAAALIALPLLAALALAIGLFTGNPAAVLPALLTAWGVLGLALGAGAITSTLIPYTVPERMNAFTGAAPGQGGQAFLGSMGSMMAVVLLALPLALPVVLGFHWLAALMLPYGLAATLLGQHLAAKLARLRLPEILAAVSRPT